MLQKSNVTHVAKYVWADGEMISVMQEQAEGSSGPWVHGSIDRLASNHREVRRKGHTSEWWSIHAFQITTVIHRNNDTIKKSATNLPLSMSFSEGGDFIFY